MFIRGNQAEKNLLLSAAEKMCLAARTAPKAKGVDKIVTGIVTSDEKDALANEMLRLFEETGAPFYKRDSQNVMDSEAVVLIGTTGGAKGLNCGFCGYCSCKEMAQSGGHCAFDDIDLGIAIGSAVSIAANDRVDNRVMLSAGVAAQNLKILGDKTLKILAIPLSATGKSPYFDR
ncbi:DUF2148 domain-containing protein [Lachnospiraceae bacterium NSJ-143]|nr:DUF2148 domain-containing protein [Lachnospiraceae bacterium NSJ-143]